MEEPGLSPMFPETEVAPVLVMVVAARTRKFPAAPRGILDWPQFLGRAVPAESPEALVVPKASPTVVDTITIARAVARRRDMPRVRFGNIAGYWGRLYLGCPSIGINAVRRDV